MRRGGFLIAALTFLVGIVATPAAETFVYTAALKSPSNIQGSVVASGISWQCKGNVCSTRGPWPKPGVSACAALANQVGEVAAYGYPSHQLSATELQSCNAGIRPARIPGLAPKFTNTPAVPPATPRHLPVILPRKLKDTFAPKVVRTIQLAVTGTVHRVRTIQLTVTGTGASSGPPPPAPPFTAKVVRTIELTLTGTGHH